jgi:hypothetical protein
MGSRHSQKGREKKKDGVESIIIDVSLHSKSSGESIEGMGWWM